MQITVLCVKYMKSLKEIILNIYLIGVESECLNDSIKLNINRDKTCSEFSC